jgi:hypothetical protein
VAFPVITTTSALLPAPTITCTAPGATPSLLPYSASVVAVFPLGNTTVTCQARDALGQPSANRTFVVAVTCAAGFTRSGSDCVGESRWRSCKRARARSTLELCQEHRRRGTP